MLQREYRTSFLKTALRGRVSRARFTGETSCLVTRLASCLLSTIHFLREVCRGGWCRRGRRRGGGHALEQSIADAQLLLARLRHFLDAIDARRFFREREGYVVFNAAAMGARGNGVPRLVTAQPAHGIARHLGAIKRVEHVAFVKAGPGGSAVRIEVGDDRRSRRVARETETESCAFLSPLFQQEAGASKPGGKWNFRRASHIFVKKIGHRGFCVEVRVPQHFVRRGTKAHAVRIEAALLRILLI